jgi:hypothetical protein
MARITATYAGRSNTIEMKLDNSLRTASEIEASDLLADAHGNWLSFDIV